MRHLSILIFLLIFFPVFAPTPTEAATVLCPAFTRTLTLGSRGADVTTLQKYLVSQNLLSADSATGYFGKLTQTALKAWQKKQGIVSTGTANTTGYGATGPKTRGALKSCSNVSYAQGGYTSGYSQGSYTGGSYSQGSYQGGYSQGSYGGSYSQGSYYAQGTYQGGQSCTFNSQTIANSSSTVAYQAASVPAGQVCISETRVCANGVLSGSYNNASCSVASAVAPPNPTKTSVALSGFRNMYAPSVMTLPNGTRRMWICGWQTDADENDYANARAAGLDLGTFPGPDKIWYSDFNGSTWSWPQLSFKKNGWHACDPSVIRPPSTDGVDRSTWLYMYFTYLDNHKAQTTEDILANNITGLASSVDGGKTWADTGVVIDRASGGDGFGAWAPSAVVVGNEIWVYYNTGNQNFQINNTFVQKFNASGWQKIGVPIPLTYGPGTVLDPGTSATLMSNLDVSYDGSQFTMFADAYDLKRIVHLVSKDGIHWTNDARYINPFVSSTSNMLGPPFAEWVDSTNFNLFLGLDETGSGSNYHSAHEWAFTIPYLSL